MKQVVGQPVLDFGNRCLPFQAGTLLLDSMPSQAAATGGTNAFEHVHESASCSFLFLSPAVLRYELLSLRGGREGFGGVAQTACAFVVGFRST